MKWIEVSVMTTEEASDAIANRMMDLKAGGVAIDDPSLIYRHAEERKWDEYYDLPEPQFVPGRVVVKAYFPEGVVNAAFVQGLREWVASLASFGLSQGEGTVTARSVNEEDWAHAWKAYYHTERIGRRLVIKPSWEDWDSQGDDVVIDMDPGMAFGTGTHPTTAMCLKALEQYVRTGDLVFDIGTGSGILSIAAAKLGADAVKAVDIDPVAVRVALDNLRRNGVEEQICVSQGVISDIAGQGDLVVANIIADILIAIADDLAARVRPGGLVLASGIIAEKAGLVAKAFETAGMTIRDQVQTGDWILLVATR